ncbi:MAG: acyl--CoA ligase, partial [Gammaproteobacteria bacterium]|nr:acyl--CoA ligase [Gammaproteobacteria bacterium]
MNLASILQCHADSNGDKTAIEYRSQRINYLQLWQHVQGYAAYLHERGIRPGDRVGLALKEHSCHLILHYALARLGAVILPIDHRWTSTERAGAAT